MAQIFPTSFKDKFVNQFILSRMDKIPHIPAQRWAKRSIFQGFFSQQEWRVRWGDTQQSIAVRMIVNRAEFFPGFKLLQSGRSGRLQQVEIYPTPRQHNKRKCWRIEGVAASSRSVFHLSGGGFKFYFKISLKTFLCTTPPFFKSWKHANDVRFLQKKIISNFLCSNSFPLPLWRQTFQFKMNELNHFFFKLKKNRN